jgi:tetratricopeptide (TPR) repeat protein
MRTHFFWVFIAGALFLAVSTTALAQSDSPIEKAIQLANQGNFKGAMDLLRDHVNKNGKDVRARVTLGQMLDDDGHPEDAVTLWERGLTGETADFPLLMSIGEIRHRQGEEGPAITHVRGMVGARPSKNDAADEEFKRSHLVLAEAAYEKARKLKPDEPDAAVALASVYSLQRKHDAAALVWKSLIAREPKNADYHLRLARATRAAGQSDLAAKYLEQTIALNPRLGAAHQELADYYKAKGRAADSEQSANRAEFYNRLPSFCTVDYSEENLRTLDSLDQSATVRKLIADRSETAAQFLAVLCWSHPHNRLETMAFEALEARGAATTPLLRAVFEQARSTCTVKSTAHILARRKAEGLFEGLARRLPGDVRGFGMEMDIAGSLDELGDARAVGPLVQVLDPGNAGDVQDQLMTDRNAARGRAALALGAFDTPESKRALLEGTQRAQIATYCLAALYRLSHDQKHFSALVLAVTPEPGYASPAVGDYLREKVGTALAKQLATLWDQRRAAKRAATRAQPSKNAPAKPTKNQ